MHNATKWISPGLAAAAFLGLAPAAHAGSCAPGVTTNTESNTCIGTGALAANAAPNGIENVAFGLRALNANTSGRYNSALGAYALERNKSGGNNTAIGAAALANNTTGLDNTVTGSWAVFSNTSGNYNTAYGAGALYASVTGSNNTAFGQGTLNTTVRSRNNTAIGMGAMGYAENVSDNVVIGMNAASYLQGSGNVALGNTAGSQWTTGNNNVAIAAPGASGESGTIRIGVQGRQSKTFIAGIRGVTVTGAVPVLVNAFGQLGIATSSRRFKQDIQPMGDASNALMQLSPVTFRYKEADAAGQKPLQYGLIAEDVQAVMPELVVRSADGQVETVAYHVLPSLLLNEYQKQNRRLAEAEAKLAASEEELAAMKAEMATMKLALGRLASAAPQIGTTLAAAQGEETALLK